MYYSFYFLLLTFFLSTAVFAGSTSPKDYPRKELLAAPQTVAIDGEEITIEPYLWRDFMPISPPDGKPLNAVVKISTNSGKKLPAGLKAKKVWIIKEDGLWSETLEQAGRKLPSESLTEMEMVARGGPKWGPGIEVTVIIQLEDDSGKTHLIRAGNQAIHRTD